MFNNKKYARTLARSIRREVMNEKVLAYKKKLESQLRTAEGKISLYERSKSRIIEKLKDVESSFSKELGRGAVKVSKIAGVEPVKKVKRIPKENVEVEKIEVPTVEMDFSPAPAPEKKSSWNPFNN